MDEAAAGMPEGWRDDDISRAWVASYRLSVYETRRHAQRFFAWAIPDERSVTRSTRRNVSAVIVRFIGLPVRNPLLGFL